MEEWRGLSPSVLLEHPGVGKEEFAQNSFAGRGSGGPGRGGFGGSPADMVARIMSNDKNGDGKVTKEELPEAMRRILDRADTNKDGAIDKAEAQAMTERIRSGRGGRPGGSGRDRGRGQRPGGDRPIRSTSDR